MGGWQVSGFLTFQSGAPFTPLAGIDPGLRLNGIDGLVGNAIRGNVATDRPISSMNISEIFAFNTPAAVNNSRNSLFANVTAANPPGNAGRNIIRADGIGEFSMGAFKKFRTFESQNLEFRAEFYNLTNTRNFGIPESRINAAAFVNQHRWWQPLRPVRPSLRVVIRSTTAAPMLPAGHRGFFIVIMEA
ncbi:MAG: hypothetical protein JJE04_18705 [Acidobacteriia bacterium]|nr:hypothetical protein [Terriglobia bacterium]